MTLMHGMAGASTRMLTLKARAAGTLLATGIAWTATADDLLGATKKGVEWAG